MSGQIPGLYMRRGPVARRPGAVGVGMSSNAIANLGVVALTAELAASGAVLGAVVGVLAKGSVKAAGVGGGIGAVIGGILGGFSGYEIKKGAS